MSNVRHNIDEETLKQMHSMLIKIDARVKDLLIFLTSNSEIEAIQLTDGRLVRQIPKQEIQDKVTSHMISLYEKELTGLVNYINKIYALSSNS